MSLSYRGMLTCLRLFLPRPMLGLPFSWDMPSKETGYMVVLPRTTKVLSLPPSAKTPFFARPSQRLQCVRGCF